MIARIAQAGDQPARRSTGAPSSTATTIRPRPGRTSTSDQAPPIPALAKARQVGSSSTANNATCTISAGRSHGGRLEKDKSGTPL